MARLLIYDAYENKVYTYANLNENDPMPYSTGTTLRVREFRGKSASPTLWTTIAAMEAWNLTRRKYGKGIPVGYAFRRIWEGGHGTRSQHYAGVSFDVGQSLTQTARTAIYNAARAMHREAEIKKLTRTQKQALLDSQTGGEMLTVYDAADRPCGTRPRSIVHAQGLRHHVCHLWVVGVRDGVRGIWLQKRQNDRPLYPGFYDLTATGHMDPGETPLTAALREAREEIGLRADEASVTPGGSYRQRYYRADGGFDDELSFVFLMRQDGVPAADSL